MASLFRILHVAMTALKDLVSIPDASKRTRQQEQAIEEVQEKFTCFPKLPPELQLEIWKFASHVPRLITLAFVKKENTHPDQYGYIGPRDNSAKRRISIQTGALALLHTCHEARAEALKYYIKLEASPLNDCKFYYNPHVDTFLMDDTSDFEEFLRRRLNAANSDGIPIPRISVAVPVTYFGTLTNETQKTCCRWFSQRFAREPTIQSITFITDSEAVESAVLLWLPSRQ